MKIEGQWIPESDEELEMMKQIHSIKVNAYNSGISPETIASMLAYASSTSIVEKPEESETRKLDDIVEKEKEKAENCIKCNEKIMNARSMGIGGDFILVPCGCEYSWDERDKIGPWIEKPKEVDNNEK